MNYSDYRRIARENLEGNWKKSLGIAFVAAIFGALLIGSNIGFEVDMDAEYIQRLPDIAIAVLGVFASLAGGLNLVHFILGGPVQLGYAHILLKQYHHQEFEVGELFSQFHRFKQGFLQSFLRGLYVALWSLLLIIPGIIASYKYAMTPFLMTDNPNMTAKEAIAASCELMDGHKGELFTLGLTFIGWELLAMLTLGIGFLWLNPYKNAAYAAFYRDLIINRNRGIE